METGLQTFQAQDGMQIGFAIDGSISHLFDPYNKVCLFDYFLFPVRYLYFLPSSTLFQLHCTSHCTYQCLCKVHFTSTLDTIMFKLAAFPLDTQYFIVKTLFRGEAGMNAIRLTVTIVKMNLVKLWISNP